MRLVSLLGEQVDKNIALSEKKTLKKAYPLTALSELDLLFTFWQQLPVPLRTIHADILSPPLELPSDRNGPQRRKTGRLVRGDFTD